MQLTPSAHSAKLKSTFTHKSRDALNSKLLQNQAAQPPCRPKRICFVGDGSLVEFDTFWCVIRASGTDAVLRYYIDGTNKTETDSALKSLIALNI